MWIRSRIAVGISSATSTRTRRFFTLICVSLLLLLVWQSYPLRTAGIVSNSCLDVALYQFIAAERRGETSITRVSHLARSSPAAVLGNGHIGIDLDEESLLFGYNGLQWLVAKYSPQLSVTVDDVLLSPGALVFEYKEATFHYLYAHSLSPGCVRVRHSIHAHRNFTSLLVQDVTVTNSASRSVVLELKQTSMSSWSGASTSRQELKAGLKTATSGQYILSQGTIPATLKAPSVSAAVASVAAPVDPIEVEAKRDVSAQFLTVVRFQVGANLSAAANSPTTNGPAVPLPNLSTAALAELEQHLAVKDAKALADRRLAHQSQWEQLWDTMPRVLSKSHPSTPGNGEIYASLFYLMATTPSLPGQYGVDLITNTDKECFSGPPTMHTTLLWLIPHRLSAIHTLVSNWHRYLAHGSCDSHLNRGAQLLGQVVTLSFLGIRHVPSYKYLDLALNPALVQADALVHNLYFAGYSISLNIQMEHGVARMMRVRAKPLVAGTQPPPPLYTCPASCTGSLKTVGAEDVLVPVIATKPVTPLLYISTHADELQRLNNRSKELQTYHLPGESPHHEWGVHTVSPRAWMLFGLLLGGFHLFLLQIICKEYCPETLNNCARFLPRRMADVTGSGRVD
eukprot:scpid56130/ scgid23380/ Uncharacterized protein KIAA2013 homolog